MQDLALEGPEGAQGFLFLGSVGKAGRIDQCGSIARPSILLHLSVSLSLILNYPDYCSFTVSLKSENVSFLTSFFFNIVFAILCCLPLYIL